MILFCFVALVVASCDIDPHIIKLSAMHHWFILFVFQVSDSTPLADNASLLEVLKPGFTGDACASASNKLLMRSETISFPESSFPLTSGSGYERLWDNPFRMTRFLS